MSLKKTSGMSEQSMWKLYHSAALVYGRKCGTGQKRDGCDPSGGDFGVYL